MRALLTLFLLLAVASPAAAATVDRTDGAIVYTGTGTEANDVSVTRTATDYVFTDAGAATITASGDCAPGVSPNVATCPREDTTRMDFELNLGDDEVSLTSLDSIIVVERGGPGTDTLRGNDVDPALGSGGPSVSLVGGPGTDLYEGGDASNTYVDYQDKTENLRISIDGQANDPDGESVPFDVFGAQGGSGDDLMTGSADTDVLQGGPGADTLQGLGALDGLYAGPGNDTIDCGDGNDFCLGEAGDDRVDGGEGDDTELSGGPGTDVVTGGPGNDTSRSDPGSDDISGGAGFDRHFAQVTDYGTGVPRDVSLTLDDVANDGQPFERDNVRSDVEDLSAPIGTGGTTPGSVTVRGDADFNLIGTNVAADDVDPGAGGDQVSTFGGDDVVRARDGFGDRIDCGIGTDTAIVDELDELTRCETVDRAASAVTPPAQTPVPTPASNDDRPPTAAFVTPRADTLLRGTSPVEVDARDDRAVSRVLLLDDGRVVEVDSAAPYRFSYRPSGDDVGRNTLVAIAIDSSEQSASAVVPVRVDRFVPRISRTVSPARDRRAPYRFTTSGRLVLPQGVTAAAGCATGFVAVQVKRGTRTVSTRRAALGRDCRFASTVVFRDRRRLGAGRLQVVVRFLGNPILGPQTAERVAVRAG